MQISESDLKKAALILFIIVLIKVLLQPLIDEYEARRAIRMINETFSETDKVLKASMRKAKIQDQKRLSSYRKKTQQRLEEQRIERDQYRLEKEYQRQYGQPFDNYLENDGFSDEY